MSTKQSLTKKVHYFHADASAIGGVINTPVKENIEVQSPVSLPPVGGFATTRSENFRLHGIITADTTHSQVSGHASEENGFPLTMMTTAVEKLNVLNILTADRVVGQISAEHHHERYAPHVSFLGTQILNLSIAGHPLEVILDLDLLDCGDGERHPKKPVVSNPRFLKKIGQSYNDDCGYVTCTLVKEIKGDFPGKKIKKNVLEVPGFGVVHLAELVVGHHSYDLVMMRLALGCPTTGDISVGSGKVNGTGGGGGR